jgi:hypothetical protein
LQSVGPTAVSTTNISTSPKSFFIPRLFFAFGNNALAVLSYRVEEQFLFVTLFENFYWVPLLMIFSGSIFLHISQDILSHLFGIDMHWDATREGGREYHVLPGDSTYHQEAQVHVRDLTCVDSNAHCDKLLIAVFPIFIVTFNRFMTPIVLTPNLMLSIW